MIEDNFGLKEFYQAYGECLATWQKIEAQLFEIFVYCVKAADPKAASASYHEVINFSTRLEMVNAAAIVCFNDNTRLHAWNDLYKKMKNLSKRRNKITHSMIVIWHVGETKNAKPVLWPHLYDWKTMESRSDQESNSYDLKYLQSAIKDFVTFDKDMGIFLTRTMKRA